MIEACFDSLKGFYLKSGCPTSKRLACEFYYAQTARGKKQVDRARKNKAIKQNYGPIGVLKSGAHFLHAFKGNWLGVFILSGTSVI